MAAALTYQGNLHEIWTEAVNQIGGAAQTVQTLIRYDANEGNNVIDTVLRLDTVTGVPTFTMTYSAVSGRLAILVTNTAGGGAANQATWTLDVRYLHTIVR